MKERGKVYKRLIAMLLVSLMVVTMFVGLVQTTNAANYDMLGTNSALGSPLLNNNMTVESFNKWETVAWGIFLSNFTVPYADTYESAFTKAGYGSNGSGAQALQFSAGSEVTNTEVIADLLNYAINLEKSTAPVPLSIVFNEMKDGITTQNSLLAESKAPVQPAESEGVEGDGAEGEGAEGAEEGASTEQPVAPPSDSGIRVARVGDLIMSTTKDDNKGWIESKDLDNNEFWTSGTNMSTGYPDMLMVKNGQIPTFVIQKPNGSIVKVLDYTDSFDLQMSTASLLKAAIKMSNNDMAIQCSPEDPLYIDCFGNIIAKHGDKNVIVVPACVNKNLTSDGQANLVNSIVLNGQTKASDRLNLVRNGGWTPGKWWIFPKGTDDKTGGPAFNNNKVKQNAGSLMVYYDTDSYYGINKSAGKDLSHGDALLSVFDAKLGMTSNTIPFKLEIFNIDQIKPGGSPDTEKGTPGDSESVVASYDNLFNDLNTMYKLSIIYSNLANLTKPAQVNTTLNMLYSATSEQSIYDDPIAVSVGTPVSSDSKNFYNVPRQYTDFVYQVYRGKESASGYSPSDISSALKNSKTVTNAIVNLSISGGKATWEGATQSDIYATPLLKSFFMKYGQNTKGESQLWKDMSGIQGDIYIPKGAWANGLDATVAKDVSLSNLILDAGNYKNVQGDNLANRTFTAISGVGPNGVPVGKSVNALARVCVVYPGSPVLSKVEDVLNVKAGAEFVTFATDAYYTYLRFYGILNDFGVSTNGHKFNKDIFDEKLVDDTSMIEKFLSKGNYMTTEQKMQAIMDISYDWLVQSMDQDKGLTNWIYNQYYKTVYGQAQGSMVTASRHSNGFLYVNNYDENFFTSTFLRYYVQMSALLIAVAFIVVIVVGLFSHAKLSWYFINLTVIISTILIVPTIGDITPYICNNMVQSTFTDQLTYWTITETLNNLKMEKDINNSTATSSSYLKGLTPDQQKDALAILKTHSSLNLDHTLTLKLDISKKVTSVDNTDYDKIMQLNTTRWMMPMMIQQWSQEDGGSDYIITTLASENDNLSNMYWYYCPDNAQYLNTIASNQPEYNSIVKDKDEFGRSFDQFIDDISARFPDYLTESELPQSVSVGGENVDADTYRSYVYTKDDRSDRKSKPHTYFYILDSNYQLPGRASTNNLKKAGRAEFIKQCLNTINNSTGKESFGLDTISKYAGTYDPRDRTTMQQSYGYLWSTQNPFHYFYMLVKESMPETKDNLEAIYSTIAGEYVADETGEKTLRDSDVLYSIINYKGEKQGSLFGPAEVIEKKVSATRDILDLEHLFNNMVPYLYEMTLATGGEDGTTGVFLDDMLDEIPVYKNNYASWLFRSNWAVKLLESPELTKSATVRDREGNRYTVENPILPSSYPSERPMIFSRAQQVLNGLDDSDLTIPEIKCVELNDRIADNWTMLINYINVKDMEPEAIYRQMALEALMEFNKAFSPTSHLDTSKVLYPESVNLRFVSFDSIMRMLMLNVSNSTSYIYNDAMKIMIMDSDILSQLMLLITTWLCVLVVPLMRDLCLALIFYLCLIATVRVLFGNAKMKVKITTGFLLMNLICCLSTSIYYAAISSMIKVDTVNSVIMRSRLTARPGSPFAVFLIVSVLSAVYLASIIWLARFCYKNRKDMGFGVFKSAAESMSSKIGGALSTIGEKIQSRINSSDSGKSSGKNSDLSGSGNTSGGKGRNIKADKVDVKGNKVIVSTGEGQSGGSSDGSSDSTDNDTKQRNHRATKTTASDNSSAAFNNASEIDKQVELGKEVEKRERQKEQDNK